MGDAWSSGNESLSDERYSDLLMVTNPSKTKDILNQS